MHNLTNYHSHCTFCDGRADAEAFIQEAIRQGFSSYGVSSHAPLPFSTHWSMEMADMPAYLERMQALKQQYANRIEVYVGLEIDYLTETHHPGIAFFRELPLDYRIGSVHLLEDPTGALADLDVSSEKFRQKIADRFENDLQGVVCGYFDKLMRMAQTGGIDIVGHADKISMNASFCDPHIIEQAWYKDKIRAWFSLVAEKGLMMEVNTKAFVEKGFFFPNREHFTLLKELGIPLMVNSDAHYPEKINDGRMQALCALKEAGITQVRELIGGRWQDVAIR